MLPRQRVSTNRCHGEDAALITLHVRFFGRMKVETFHDYRWENKTELVTAVEDYLKFYNEDRITNMLGGLTIEEHRRMMTA